MSAELNNATINEACLNRNVGYTVVGSPTITDGVVSGFSTDDYIELKNTISSVNNLSLITKITTASSTNIYRFILGSKETRELTIAQGSNKKLRLQLGNTGTAYYTELLGLTELQPSTTYYIKVEYSNSNFTMYLSLDGNTWTNEGSITYQLNAITLRFGVTWTSSTNYWRGSIDLNYTYIKVNGITFFNGKETASSTANEVYYNKNCGYTVVGNPTIVDGVVSGFSANNYLKTSSGLDWSNVTNYEVVIRAKRNDTTTNNALIGTSSGGVGDWKILFSKQSLRFIPSRSTDSIEITNNFGTDYYYIRVRYNNATATVDYSTDGINYQGATTKTFTELTTNTATVTFGYLSNYTSYFDGSIDLNHTYIKVNDVTWFNGKQAASNAVWTRGT